MPNKKVTYPGLSRVVAIGLRFDMAGVHAMIVDQGDVQPAVTFVAYDTFPDSENPVWSAMNSVFTRAMGVIKLDEYKQPPVPKRYAYYCRGQVMIEPESYDPTEDCPLCGHITHRLEQISCGIDSTDPCPCRRAVLLPTKD